MIRIELPLPPAQLNPNRKNGTHWAMSQRAKASYRETCWGLTVQARARAAVPADGDLALRITFRLPTKRRVDSDNLLASAKAGLDGVAAALQVDDSRFEPVTVCREFGAASAGMVVEVGA